jgi:hypothetical protein
MGSGRNSSRKKNQETVQAHERQAQGGALVPFYGVPGITTGIQAFRRGNVILYTVRGEPKEVQALIGQLDQQGGGEVVALISHRADPPQEDGAGKAEV